MNLQYFQSPQMGKPSQDIDATYLETSSWTRFVNCARTPQELNVNLAFCRGRAYYIVSKDISPGQELFAYYGQEDAERLGIDHMQFYAETTGKFYGVYV